MPADPWVPDPLAGAELLDDVAAFLSRFVAFPSDAARVAVALWAAHTHLIDEFESTGRLALLSPEPGSGKTRTLEVLALLCYAPMPMVNANPAPVFRRLHQGPRTLLLDECDAIFGSRLSTDDPRADLRALLNEGHRRGATVDRCVGPKHEVQEFPVFAACALAGLGDLPDTLMSRSVIVRMRRRAPGEHVEPFRRRLHADLGEQLHVTLAEWANEVRADIAGAWPDMPDGIVDRPADVWEPLLAVADVAGGHWPETARAACIELCKVAESREASLGVRLLADLRDVFSNAGNPEVMSTESILDELHKLDEAPWADLRGRPLDARGLARRIRLYEVTSTKVKVEARALQGYRREHLWDAWSRYLPAPTSIQAEPAEPPERARSEPMSWVPHVGQVPEPSSRTEPATEPLTCEVPPVPEVPSLQDTSEPLAEYLVHLPGRCPACAHHVAAQGHASNCERQAAS